MPLPSNWAQWALLGYGHCSGSRDTSIPEQSDDDKTNPSQFGYLAGIIQTVTTCLSQMPVKNDTKKLRHHIHIDTFQLACLTIREVCSNGMSDENQFVLSVGSFVSLRLELRSFVIVQGQIAQSLELDCLAEAEFFMVSHQEQLI